MEHWKFQDLMKGHMYFRRADLFDDESEGLPLDDYVHTLGLNPHDLNDIQKRNDALGFDAQIRQGFYITCWYLAGEETAKMWHTYAKGDGVAVVSTYGILKSVLDALTPDDDVNLGLVRYGNRHLVEYPRRNLMVNISTKREQYAHEKEVRALLWIAIYGVSATSSPPPYSPDLKRSTIPCIRDLNRSPMIGPEGVGISIGPSAQFVRMADNVFNSTRVTKILVTPASGGW